MADLAQVLAAGGTALVSAAAGAGLTYWLGTLNRRHQEAREDETRWYEARREAYGALHIAASRVMRYLLDTPGKPELAMGEMLDEIIATLSPVHLVGSPAARTVADNLIMAIFADAYARAQNVSKLVETSEDEGSLKEQLQQLPRSGRTSAAFMEFVNAARKDLGHP